MLLVTIPATAAVLVRFPTCVTDGSSIGESEDRSGVVIVAVGSMAVVIGSGIVGGAGVRLSQLPRENPGGISTLSMMCSTPFSAVMSGIVIVALSDPNPDHPSCLRNSSHWVYRYADK